MTIDKKLVSSCYDDWAKNYDADSLNNAAIGIDRPIVLEFLKNELNRSSVGLDLGCGTGLLMKEIAPKIQEIMGIDISKNMIKKSKENLQNLKNIILKQNDIIKELKIQKSSSFDFVVSSLTVCHINESKVLFEEVKRVLKSGGIFIFDDIISKLKNSFSLKHFDYLGEYSKKGQLWQRRTKEDYIELLENTDFGIIELRETSINEKSKQFLTKEDYENNKGCDFTIIFKAQKH